MMHEITKGTIIVLFYGMTFTDNSHNAVIQTCGPMKIQPNLVTVINMQTVINEPVREDTCEQNCLSICIVETA